jgi:hypothetical protein
MVVLLKLLINEQTLSTIMGRRSALDWDGGQTAGLLDVGGCGNRFKRLVEQTQMNTLKVAAAEPVGEQTGGPQCTWTPKKASVSTCSVWGTGPNRSATL